jgi:hypothetical protein
MAKVYRNIAVSCKAKELLDEIAKAMAVNRGAFVEKLIEKAHKELVEQKKEGV